MITFTHIIVPPPAKRTIWRALESYESKIRDPRYNTEHDSSLVLTLQPCEYSPNNDKFKAQVEKMWSLNRERFCPYHNALNSCPYDAASSTPIGILVTGWKLKSIIIEEALTPLAHGYIANQVHSIFDELAKKDIKVAQDPFLNFEIWRNRRSEWLLKYEARPLMEFHLGTKAKPAKEETLRTISEAANLKIPDNPYLRDPRGKVKNDLKEREQWNLAMETIYCRTIQDYIARFENFESVPDQEQTDWDDCSTLNDVEVEGGNLRSP